MLASTGPWPLLRQELELLPGPSLADGQPSWTIHDPARNLFFRIDWLTFEILQRWGLGQAQAIAQDIAGCTTLQADPEDVQHVREFLTTNQLTQAHRANGMAARQLAERVQKNEKTTFQWLVHNYLFFRVPLVRPDAWLNRWLPLAAFFWSRTFAWATMAALIAGLALVLRHAEVFWSSLVDTFTWQGLAAYAVALFCVKVLHELGHAFTAKRHGCKVPAMGVAFLVMWPVAYTDINDAWRITRHKTRLQISSAGILTEITIAIWATLFWALLADGPLRSALFFLATTSWVLTVFINASPFMRFDGYFVLSDALNTVNLHERSFALTRWKLREWLFALGDAPPEHLPAHKTQAMIAFGWATWLYRLALFLGIAVLVYHFFFKLLGVLLFAVEILWFVALPIWREIKVWLERRVDITRQPRFRRTSAIFGMLVLLLLLPWPGRHELSGLLRPVQSFTLTVPANAQLHAWLHPLGQTVQAGQALVELRSPELTMKQNQAQERLQRAQWVAAKSGLDKETAQRLQTHESESLEAEKQVQALQSDLDNLQLRAPFTGRLMDVPPDLHPGTWLVRNERIGSLQDTEGPWLVESWIDERSLDFVREGDQAYMYLDGDASGPIALRLSLIERDATRILPRPELAATLGGHILTRVKDKQHHAETAIYRVVFEVQTPLHSGQRERAWRGRIQVHGQWHSPLWPYLRQAMLVLVREFTP